MLINHGHFIMDTTKHVIPAGEFKAKCLGIIEDIHETGKPIVITKRGIPWVEIVPYYDVETPKRGILGCMKGSITINADIVAPIHDKWNEEE